MEILYIGDFLKKNGPSQVDINLTQNLLGVQVYKEQINKKFTFNFFKNLRKSSIIVISGVSFKGTITSILANIFSKKVVFIMHGALKIEKNYRCIPITRQIFEKIKIKASDKIVCVSKIFSENVKEIYNEDSSKITYINNGVNLKEFCVPKNKIRKQNMVTLGGGREEKGVLNICRSIESIKKQKNINIDKLIVIGEDGQNKEEICRYDFVEWKGFLSHEEVVEIFNENKYFIQNSFYESFGIAPIEAYLSKCQVICSSQVPSSLLLNIDSSNLHNPYNIEGISENIKKHICNKELKNSLKNMKIKTWKNTGIEYKKLFQNILQE